MQAQTGPIGAARYLAQMFGQSARPAQPHPQPRPAPFHPLDHGDWTETDEDDDEEDDGDQDEDENSWDDADDQDEDDDPEANHLHMPIVSAVASSNKEDLVHGLECIICTDPYLTKMAALPCGHVFHIECTLMWINQMGKRTCPHCRKHANRYTEIYIDKPNRPSDTSTTLSSTGSADPELAANLATAHHKIKVLESSLRAADKRIEDEKKACATRIATTAAVEADRDRLHVELCDAREKFKQDLAGRDRRHAVIVGQERKAKEAAERLVLEKVEMIATLNAKIDKRNQEVKRAAEVLEEERGRRHKVESDYQQCLRQTSALQRKVESLTRQLQEQQQLASSQADIASPPLVDLTHSSPLAARPSSHVQQNLQPKARPPVSRTPYLSSSAASASGTSRATPSVKRPAATSAQALSLVADDDDDAAGLSHWHNKRRKFEPESFSAADDALDNAFETRELAEVGKSTISLPSSSPIVDRRLKYKLSGFKKPPPMQTRLTFGKK